jgi:phosphoribosyl 1,2-cyclic phosphodiesterase
MKMLIGGCSPHGTGQATTAYGFYFDREENNGVSIGIMVDNGSGVQKVVDFMLEHNPDTTIQLQTHAHFDHVQGIHDNYLLSSQRMGYVITLPSTLESMRALLRPPYWPVEKHIHGQILWDFNDEAEILLGQGHIVIQPKLLPHGEIPSLGFKIYTPQFEIVVATDCELKNLEYQRSFLEWSKDADLILIDTNYTIEEYLFKTGWGHNSSGIVQHVIAKHSAKRKGSRYFLVHGSDEAYSQTLRMGTDSAIHVATENAKYKFKRR